VLVYETDGKLAAGLHTLCERRSVRLRELRHAQGCLRTLRRHGAGVLIIKLGRDLAKELALLEQVSWQFPDTAVIVVGDHANPALAGLVWDLGARYVLFPPQPPELLAELVDGFLPATTPAATEL
jgi:DNA-binding NarL/FixJ family response regulator